MSLLNLQPVLPLTSSPALLADFSLRLFVDDVKSMCKEWVNCMYIGDKSLRESFISRKRRASAPWASGFFFACCFCSWSSFLDSNSDFRSFGLVFMFIIKSPSVSLRSSWPFGASIFVVSIGDRLCLDDLLAITSGD